MESKQPEALRLAEMKHTPGPWRIGTAPPNGEQTIGTIRGMMVAVATTGVGMDEETLANARLIATAPELLEALQEVLPMLEHLLMIRGEPEPGSIGHKARAAIAKAIGA